MQAYLEQQQLSKHKRNFRLKLYFGFLILIAILGLIFYIIFYSPIFQIKQFNIAGKERLSDEKILGILQPLVLSSRLENFFGLKNLLVWKSGKVDVSRTALAEASINKDWLRQSLNIQIKERSRLAVWCTSKGYCYWIDEEGLAFEEAPFTEGSLILTVQEKEKEIIIKGEPVVEKRFSGNIIKIIEGISNINIPIEKITFDRELQEIQIQTYKGPDILFSIRFNPEFNLNSLQTLRQKIGFERIEYIDLRAENRIFYKNF